MLDAFSALLALPLLMITVAAGVRVFNDVSR